MVQRRFSPGETIFNEGDFSDECYIVRSGRVDVLKNTHGACFRLAVLGQGDVLGEMGLLDERVRSATARAVGNVVVDVVGRAEFVRILLHEPHKSMELLRAIFERLRTMNQMVVESAPAHAVPHSRVTLIPLTPQTCRALPPEGIEITRFPFRVGRAPESRDSEVLSFNELELADAPPYTVSLNHFALDLGPGGVLVRDRGSQHGTVVNETHIGVTAKRDSAPLHAGENHVVVGEPSTRLHRAESPFRFKVIVE